MTTVATKSVVGRVASPGEHRDATQPRSKRLRRLSSVWANENNPFYFLTICLQDRTKKRPSSEMNLRLKEFLQNSPKNYGWFPIQYVLMQDHLHLLAIQDSERRVRPPGLHLKTNVPIGGESLAAKDDLHPKAGAHSSCRPGGLTRREKTISLGEWIKALKAFVGQRQIRWQPSFFDHVVRNEENLNQKWDYILNNPVRKGLVQNANDWPFAGELNWDSNL